MNGPSWSGWERGAGGASAAPGGGDRGDLPPVGGTYGSPKVFIELVRRDRRVSVHTVAKLMAELGPVGRKRRRSRSPTRPGERPAASDFVRRGFTAEEPDFAWVDDMTNIDTGEGKLYLATVMLRDTTQPPPRGGPART
ncbi:IS3 family transposase [Streptomyces sp. NPDC050743]|uniref:IS3 family transposase n=1 Tax=Streptomyces sp. NPDC050743 TaxID=3365634 RepID=UPI00378E6624